MLRPAHSVLASSALFTIGLALVPGSARAQPGPAVVQNPSHVPNPDPVVIDLRPGADTRDNFESPYPATPRFTELDQFATDRPDPDITPSDTPHRIPGGLAQVGTMVVPEAMLDGADMVPNAAAQLANPTDPAAGGGGAPDLEEICAFPEEVPPGIYEYDARPGGETPRFHTVYLNYLGGVLNGGGENSAENLSGIARSGHPYPVYAGGEMRAIAAAQAVIADFEDWAVRVVYEERPPKVLPYTMVMMGGHWSDTTASASGGVAPLDCEDFGQRNVCYVFQNISPATTQANIASQEIGHTLGLGHTNASDSVMAAGYAQTQPGDLGFNETCAPIIAVAGQAAACIGVNKCHCGEGEAQHDKNTLSVTFAPAGVDMIEPTIDITSPPDGTVYEEGEDVVVEVDPWDDVGGYGWKLILEDENGEVLADKVDYDRALEFKLIGVPVGNYVATAHIQDHADHIVTQTISFSVVPAGSQGETGDETDDGSGTDSAGGSDSASSGGDGPGPDSEGDTETDDSSGSDSAGSADDTSDGCGCRNSAPTPSFAWLALLGIALVRRRRD